MEVIPSIIHPSWHEHLQPLFNDNKMILLKNRILPKCKYYPEAAQIFRVFSMPIDQIKVVILGQDPYPNGSANGLAFAVNQATKIPKSLDVIKNEIINSSVERDTHTRIEDPKWKTLYHLTQQGVFLLNTALTVEIGQPGSHTGQWQWFVREVLSIISKNHKCIWLLWGAKAKSLRSYIFNNTVYIDGKTDLSVGGIETNWILEADHPSAESRPENKGKYQFSGCNHFNLCNKLLKYQNKNIINW